ncbi:MAG: hypothetical protein IJ657_07085, partial [Acidaminococcaceae bacterium]|nr:hypothetical protein [Acidaminococcaceae bacterium]
MRHTMTKQILMGLMTAMVAVSPVFAETTPTISQQVSPKRKTVDTSAQGKEPAQAQENAGQEARPNRLNLPPREAPEPAQDLLVTQEDEGELAPYLEKML